MKYERQYILFDKAKKHLNHCYFKHLYSINPFLWSKNFKSHSHSNGLTMNNRALIKWIRFRISTTLSNLSLSFSPRKFSDVLLNSRLFWKLELKREVKRIRQEQSCFANIVQKIYLHPVHNTSPNLITLNCL